MKKIPYLLLILLVSCSKQLDTPADIAQASQSPTHLKETLSRGLNASEMPSIQLNMYSREDSTIPPVFVDSIQFIYDTSFVAGVGPEDVNTSVRHRDGIAAKISSGLYSTDGRPLPLKHWTYALKTGDYGGKYYYSFTFVPKNIPPGYGFLLIDHFYIENNQTVTKGISISPAQPTEYRFENYIDVVDHFPPPEHRFVFEIYKR